MLDLLYVIAFFAVIFYAFGGMKKIRGFSSRMFRGGVYDWDIREIEGRVVIWRAENPDRDYSDPEAQRIIRKCIQKIHRLRDKNAPGDPEAHITKLAKLLK